jgi:putative acyl-CoA dehydrogenase
VLTPAAKYWICKRGPALAAEAMEVLGGNGYVEEGPLARNYRQMPLNSIWEGSGNIMCLDVLRALGRDSRSGDALWAEVDLAVGDDSRFDAFVADLKKQSQVENQSRRLTQGIALAMQGSLLLRHAPGFVAEAFCASRFGRDTPYAGGAFGALPAGTKFEALLQRAWPAA